MVFQRVIAILILGIPGAIGVYGWTWMRDVFFDYMAGRGFDWLSFFGGLTLFLIGVAFLGGFIFHRDAKRNKIQPKLQRKKE
jgi:hypothetical protein